MIMDELSLKQLETLVKAGNSDAMTELGNRYVWGLDVKTNVNKGYELLQKAAADNNVNALDSLASLHINGRLGSDGGVIEKDDQKAYDYLAKAAELNSHWAQSTLSVFVMEKPLVCGLAPEENAKLSFYWCSKAVEQCNPTTGRSSVTAMHQLGLKYRDGVGTKQDTQKAIYWLRGAAARSRSANKAYLDLLYALQPENQKAI